MRRLNLVFLAILLAVVALLGGGMHLVHGFQIRRNASALLDRARRAEADKDLDKAEQSLSQYLNLRREDGPTWAWYARVVDEHDSQNGREHVFLVHEEAFRYNPADSKLERRCAELALEVGRYSDAQRHLKNLRDKGEPSDTELAELEDLLGQCARGLTRLEDADKLFDKALAHDAHRVDCYDRLARLRRVDLRLIETADGTIEEMIAKNPESGRAYIHRWRYKHEFAPPADAADIQKALKLAPDDLEVLFTAAVASEQEQDGASARAYFERGFKLNPKRAAFALGLASLETRERHLDRAEAVLRQSYQANPSLTLAFVLAETLILQDKIDGKDGAESFIALIQGAGLGDTIGRFLEAEILLQQKKWTAAIRALEMARPMLMPDPQLIVRLDLMLAECYSRIGNEEQRLDALRQAAEGDRGPESARREFAQGLVRAGKLDQAVTILLPLADRRPEWRLDLVRLLIRRAIRQPRDQRNWPEVERHLREAEMDRRQAVESLTLLRLDLLAAQGGLKEAGALLDSALKKDPRNLQYRLASARLAQRQGQGREALQILDRTETDLGPSLELQLARLDHWGLEGGDTSKAAVARLAATRQQIPAADRPAFLEQLTSAEIRLGQLYLARQHGRELATLQPENLGIRLGLFDLALSVGDHSDAENLVAEIRNAEGDEGTSWPFAQAALLIDQVRRGAPEKLDEARRIASEIAERRPQWSAGFALSGEIAELKGQTDEAIKHYTRAVELGNVQLSLVRRLLGLLAQRDRFDEIDRVAQVLRDQGAALDQITIVKALDAIRRQEFERGIVLARQAFPETSTNYADLLNLGRIYMAAEQTDEAGKAFHRATELGPGVPESWLTYVQYLVQTKRMDQARATVEAARKALPADRSTLTLAQCSLFVGDAKQAEDLIGKALNEEGKSADPAALRLAATVSLNQNQVAKVDEYLNRLDRVPDLSPGDKAWVNRTRIAILLRQNRPANRDQALQLVDQNLKDDPDSLEDQLLKATILVLQPDRRGEAIMILERLFGTNRLGTNERFFLAQLYLGQQDVQKYQDEMRKLLGLKVRNPQHLAHFVSHWIGLNQLDQADRWLAELKKAEPQGLPALELEARLLDLRKRKPELLALLEAREREVPDQIGPVADLLNRYGFTKEAEVAYKAFAARDLKQPERILALARFLARQDRIAEAMEILKKAWSTCRPEQVAAAALSLYDRPPADDGQKRQVEAWMVEAVQKRPEAVDLAANLGVVWIRTGQFDAAEALYRRMLLSNPNNPDALNNLAWLLALRDQPKAEEAMGLIAKAVDMYGPSSKLVDTLAVVLIRTGKFDQAVEQLIDAQQRAPEKSSLALHLAWAYEAKGQSAEARKQFLRAEKLGMKIQTLDPLERVIVRKLHDELFPG
jgi:tetratricopeptide (TPR) repeat protein